MLGCCFFWEGGIINTTIDLTEALKTFEKTQKTQGVDILQFNKPLDVAVVALPVELCDVTLLVSIDVDSVAEFKQTAVRHPIKQDKTSLKVVESIRQYFYCILAVQ